MPNTNKKTTKKNLPTTDLSKPELVQLIKAKLKLDGRKKKDKQIIQHLNQLSLSQLHYLSQLKTATQISKDPLLNSPISTTKPSLRPTTKPSLHPPVSSSYQSSSFYDFRNKTGKMEEIICENGKCRRVTKKLKKPPIEQKQGLILEARPPAQFFLEPLLLLPPPFNPYRNHPRLF